MNRLEYIYKGLLYVEFVYYSYSLFISNDGTTRISLYSIPKELIRNKIIYENIKS